VKMVVSGAVAISEKGVKVKNSGLTRMALA